MKKFFKFFGIVVIGLLVLIIIIAVSSENVDSKKDETEDYKVSIGKITNEMLLINLAVKSEDLISTYDEIENVKVDIRDIEAERLIDSQNQQTNEVYENIYYISGKYSWKGFFYNFQLCISFEENNVEESGSILQYISDMNKNNMNVDRKPIE